MPPFKPKAIDAAIVLVLLVGALLIYWQGIGGFFHTIGFLVCAALIALIVARVKN